MRERIVLRDSDDLGLDKGMKVEIVRVRNGKMTIFVPSLDITIDGVDYNHPDLGGTHA